MSRQPKQKLKMLYLKKYLEQNTDSEHGTTVDQLIRYLDSNGISSERKAIYNDLELLRDYGMDIEQIRSKHVEYRLMSREFQLAELKLLVDAVGASKFITKKKSRELITKLESLASSFESRQLQRSVYVDKRIKTMNESIYYSVDTIHNAINRCNKLSFQYFVYATDKTRCLKKGGALYIVDPLALTYSDENYYLYAYSEEHGEIRTYRVDRMTATQELSEPRTQNELIQNFDPAVYAGEMFSMFSGSKKKVTLRFEDSLSTVVIDRFGNDIIFMPSDDGYFTVNVELMISPTFLGWLFGFGTKASIVSPDEVKAQYQEMLQTALAANKE